MIELGDDWHEVCAADELQDEEILQIWVNEDVPLAVYNIDGEYYATDDYCSHQQALLSEGFVTGDEVECPVHQCRYHVPSGAVRAGPANADLATFSVALQDGRIYVQYAETI